MGNARATKFLKGHCPTLPMPLFFLMGIAQVCPCPKIVPVKQHYTRLKQFAKNDKTKACKTRKDHFPPDDVRNFKL